MTVAAHNKRRFHGSKEEADAPACLEREKFNLRTLSPWLYSDNIPSSKESKQKKVVRNAASAEPIREWLAAHGNGSAAEIADGLRIDPKTANAALVRGIDGVVVVERRPRRGKPARIWGIQANGIS